MGATQSGAIYQFKVALIGITPPIWRRVQVTVIWVGGIDHNRGRAPGNLVVVLHSGARRVGCERHRT